MDKYVIYFGHFELPDKNALAHRVRANAELLKVCKYRVILVGYSKSIANQYVKNSDDFYEIKYPQKPKEWFRDFQSYKIVSEIIEENGADNCKAIIMTGVGVGNSWGLANLSKKTKVPLVFDAVDGFLYSKGRPFYNFTKFIYGHCSAFVQKKVKNIIAISTYLSKQYKSVNKVVIPSLTFENDERFKNISEYVPRDFYSFCYAGNPGIKGSKDRLDWCVKAFMETAPQNAVLYIFGIEKDFFKRDFEDVAFDKRVLFYGHCNNSTCLNAISTSDFFVFAREDTKITRSGFPTKFSESLAVGTPVITTPTSDLKKYLINGKNGFISEKTTYESFKKAFSKAFVLDHHSIKDMHGKTSPLAEMAWKEKMEEFMDNLI